METFSISWFEALSHRMIPRGETVNETFWSFFPLALAWRKEHVERGKGGKRKGGGHKNKKRERELANRRKKRLKPQVLIFIQHG